MIFLKNTKIFQNGTILFLARDSQHDSCPMIDKSSWITHTMSHTNESFVESTSSRKEWKDVDEKYFNAKKDEIRRKIGV